ncbi:hypothetical protein ABS735_23815 [Streptomyces sp. MMCC 100]|uniref:hypothetical protein n=1 Tax=Streptomyces sp. MMCC 100 TaxID=3163555 RepID=UPI0035957EFB
MSGILLYTAAPDSEGTLGGLVSLRRSERLGPAIDQALEEARLCSSDPMCAEHDPRVHSRLHGAACHACLFAAETSPQRPPSAASSLAASVRSFAVSIARQ